MKFFRTFHETTPNDADAIRINTCYHNIKRIITKECGTADFIERDGSVAFSGSLQKPKLLLTVSIMQTKGKHCLYADLDDETSWQEWDYKNQTEFENAIAEYIVPLVNRTIKTVTEKKKYKYIKISRYYLNSDDQWTLIDEDIIDYTLICLFLFKDQIKEEIQSF